MAAKTFYKLSEARKRPEKVRRLVVYLKSKRQQLPDFSVFPNLEDVSIYAREHITEFPTTLFACTRLRELLFVGSNVTSIPPGIAALGQLEELVVHSNALTALPDDVVELGELRNLSSSSNRLERLPSRLDRLTQLERLNVEYNALERLPAALFRMHTLQYLHVGSNPIRRKPTKLRDLANLRLFMCDWTDLWIPPPEDEYAGRSPIATKKAPSTKKRKRRPSVGALVKALSDDWKADEELAPDLRRGATKVVLRKAERALGIPLPNVLVALHRAHDGTGYGLIDGYYRLLSLSEMVAAKRELDDMESKDFFDGWRRGEWWNARWLPFLDSEGDHLCLDLETGEVITFHVRDRARPADYESLHAWLHTLHELTRRLPADAHRAEWITSSMATKVRKDLNPGYPKRRVARKRPERVALPGAKLTYQRLTKGDRDWEIIRVKRFIRRLVGHKIVIRQFDKGFPDEAKARAFMAKAIADKLAAGYVADTPLTTRVKDQHFTKAAAEDWMRQHP